MSQATDMLESGILNHLLRETTLSKPTSIYIGIASGVLHDAITGSNFAEFPFTGGYARVPNVSGIQMWSSVGAGGVTTNMQAITFPTATTNWGLASGLVFCDAATGGNAYLWGYLSTGRQILAGDTFLVSSGNLSVTAA